MKVGGIPIDRWSITRNGQLSISPFLARFYTLRLPHPAFPNARHTRESE